MSSKKNARKQAEAAVSDVEDESPEEVSEPEPEPKTKKRGAPAAAAKKSAKKSKQPSSAEESNSEDAEEDEGEEEVEQAKPVKGKRSRAKAVDGEWKEKQPAKKATGVSVFSNDPFCLLQSQHLSLIGAKWALITRVTFLKRFITTARGETFEG